MAKLLFLLLISLTASAQSFRVASYNVENLFDLNYDKTEYKEYIPFSDYGWNERNYKIKLSNIASVITSLQTDIVALQEIESKDALMALQNELLKMSQNFPYYAISNSHSGVKCALLSKFPIKKIREIDIERTPWQRSILSAEIEIGSNLLTVLVNHWKSKASPESERIKYAKALKKDIDKLYELNREFIVLGDFNSNYNEYTTFIKKRKLNNSGDITGINHILKSVDKRELINKQNVLSAYNSLYNAWLELSKEKRWSYIFRGKKETPDSILLPRTLFDKKGVEFVHNSFTNYYDSRLYNGKRILRWKIKYRHPRKHIGEGYSDHLPIYADFTTN